MLSTLRGGPLTHDPPTCQKLGVVCCLSTLILFNVRREKGSPGTGVMAPRCRGTRAPFSARIAARREWGRRRAAHLHAGAAERARWAGACDAEDGAGPRAPPRRESAGGDTRPPRRPGDPRPARGGCRRAPPPAAPARRARLARASAPTVSRSLRCGAPHDDATGRVGRAAPPPHTSVRA